MQEIEVVARLAYADLRLCHIERDVKRALSWFHPDATLFLPGDSPVTGILQIENYLAAWYSTTKILDVTFKIIECAQADSLAFDIAKYELRTHATPSGVPSIERGSHLVLWRPNSDGEWRIHRDMAAIEY